MTNHILEKLFEHNNWANEQIIRACLTLSDEQLDAEPQSATEGSIRSTLTHLVSAQRGYLALLIKPVTERRNPPLSFAELPASIRDSGEGLLALIRNTPSAAMTTQLQTTNRYHVMPWVVLVQVINHATEHREQIKSMLSALGVTPPSIDGWDYGEVTGDLAPSAEKSEA